jgi:hypothetical protein
MYCTEAPRYGRFRFAAALPLSDAGMLAGEAAAEPLPFSGSALFAAADSVAGSGGEIVTGGAARGAISNV